MHMYIIACILFVSLGIIEYACTLAYLTFPVNNNSEDVGSALMKEEQIFKDRRVRARKMDLISMFLLTTLFANFNVYFAVA